MEERKNSSKLNIPSGAHEVDLSVLIRSLLNSFSKLWWLAALLTAILAVGALLYSMRSYHPMYRAQATFTVETYHNADTGYSFFYDNRTAAQLALTFPYLLDSDLLLDRVKSDMGVTSLNGTPSARVIENSNLFTLAVVSRDPQEAYDMLLSLIKNYPVVAEYVIGRIQLNMIDHPEFPSTPYNSSQNLKSAVLGGIVGLVLGFGIILLHALMRNTVCKESDITDKLNSDCLGTIPLVIPKGNRKMAALTIHNNKVGTPFKEGFRGLAMQTTRVMEDRKVLLVTATTKKEGTSTVVQNLALAIAEHGKQVAILDSKTHTPDQIHQMQAEADYVLIDAPACENLSKLSPYAERADAILYAIRQDYTKLPRIMNCFEDLNHFDAKLIGCVITGMRSGLTGYGYGYGYGYGKGYGYGRYGNYGYGEGPAGKYAADKE